jgi:HD-GYP domain-containing protein (c-di-GMP phosphodiesterase class II)
MLQKVTTSDLKVGMFVADLDRPWMDTPFLLQGFVVENDEQIAEVRAQCKWVLIDPLRSSGVEFEVIQNKKAAPPPKREVGNEPRVTIYRTEAPKTTNINDLRKEAGAPATSAAMSSANKAKSNKVAEAKKTSPATTRRAPPEVGIAASGQHSKTDGRDYDQHHRPSPGLAPARESVRREKSGGLFGVFGQLKKDVTNLFSKAPKEEFDFDQYTANTDSKPYARPEFIPENVQLTIYEDRKTVEHEISAATDAFSRTQDMLHTMVQDIRSGKTMHVEVIESVIEDMVDSMVRNPDAMMWVARLREQDTMTYDHGLSVAINLVAFGRHLGFPKEQLSHLGVIGLLLDIGKIRVPRELLEKNSQLTPQEFAELKKHVNHSMDILNQTANVHPDVMDGVAQHHERMDGSGYPFALQGKKITVFGKMAAIADTFAAITQKRPYAEPASAHDALQMLSNWGGTLFQADMVEHFIQSIGVFPVGSLVELSTGEIAIVVTHNRQKRLRPKVLVVTDADKTVRKYPTVLDLIYDVSDKPTYIRRGLPSNAYGIDPTEFYLT